MSGRAYDTIGKPALSLAARVAMRGALPTKGNLLRADTLIRYACAFGGATPADVRNALPHRAFLRLQRWQRASAVRKPQGEALRLEAEAIAREERAREEAERAARVELEAEKA